KGRAAPRCARGGSVPGEGARRTGRGGARSPRRTADGEPPRLLQGQGPGGEAGAHVTVEEDVMAVTDGWGVDVAVAGGGIPETFDMATQIVPPGGARRECRCAREAGRAAIAGPWIHSI